MISIFELVMRSDRKDKRIAFFRGKRQFVLNILGLGFFIALLGCVIVSASLTSQRDFEITSIFLLPVILLLFVVFLRSFHTSIVELYSDVLVYRTPLFTRRYKRSEIVQCGAELRLNGVFRLWQPYLVLSDNRKIYLVDLATGYRSGMGVPDQYGEWTASLVTTLTAWITDSRHE